jgi:hypothetical protein
MEYRGEYGTELVTFVPYVHYLKKNNKLPGKVKTYRGMRSYYFFLNDDEIEFKDDRRDWIHPQRRDFLPPHFKDEDELFSTRSSPPGQFHPPDFLTFYKRFKIKGDSDKPILLIQNKYNSEWDEPPKNFFDEEFLEQILKIVCPRFTVIYIRSNDSKATDYSPDHNELFSYELNEKDMIKRKFPMVHLFEDLGEQYKNVYDFNTLKCIVHANAKATLSVHGGASYFDSYFPSKHILYCAFAPPIFTEHFFQNQNDMCCVHPTKPVQYLRNKKKILEALTSLS